MRTSALQYLYLQKPIRTVVFVCAFILLPWLGADFYTKGEPREASVAVSMLKTGNWILPQTYAEEFAYKPPMAHWLIAAISLPRGHVTEFTARLPSAIAQIVLLGCILVFFGKRIRFQEAFIATVLLLTSFEIHRAGMTARVDMLLTAFIVLGLTQLYRWENKLELKGLPVLIPTLFSCAILTKGPVGIILPLFIFFVYLLILRKYTFLKILKALVYIGLSSMFIPMIWYIGAYKQGGDAFLNVALAENFGRFFHISGNAIDYELGHESGFYYNFVTLLAGFVPWTLLFVFSLFGIKWKKPHLSLKQILINTWNRFLAIEKMKRYSIVATVCILFFYSIPSSKRSVYLMPAYPFISILLAQYFIYIAEHRSKVMRIFASLLTTVVSAVFVVGILMMTQLVDFHAIAEQFTTKASTLLSIKSITGAFTSNLFINGVILILLLISIITAIYQTNRRINIKILYATFLMTICLNLCIDGIVMKGFKNHASARPFAEQIRRDYKLEDKVYVMNNLREYGNLYGMNFYMGNSFRNFELEQPLNGYFLTIDRDVKKVLERYSSQYQFEQLAISEYQADIRDKAVLFRFIKKF